MSNYFTKLLLSLFVFTLPFGLKAQIITTIAGNGSIAYTGNGIPATSTGLNYPPGIAVDTSGNIYVTDQDNNAIRKITTAGLIYTVAGIGASGYSGDNGPATNAKLNQPTNVTFDHSGNLYIADEFNNVIRKVSTLGIITTIAGNGTPGYTGDGAQATNATLNRPYHTVIDTTGNLFIADQFNHVIRKVNTAGIITTIAGNGTAGFSVGGPATAAELQAPEGLAFDTSGNLYIADANNHDIFKVNTSGIISLVAGTDTSGYSGDGGPASAAKFDYPAMVAFDKTGNLYVSDYFKHVIRKINTTGIITTIAGTGTAGFMGDGGPATAAQLNGPIGMAFDNSGNLIFADCNNYRVRKLSLTSLNTTLVSKPETTFFLFPNPTTGNFNLSGTLNTNTSEFTSLTVSDISGNTVYKNTFLTQNGKINESINLDKGLPNGMYLLHINAEGENDVLPFVVRR